MSKIILTSFALILLPILSLAQTPDSKHNKVISVCPFQLNDTGKMATFRFTFTYILDVDTDGRVSKIKPLASTNKYSAMKFVKVELFVDCMKGWKLEPTGKYTVQFNVGTTGIGTNKDMPFNYMAIFGPDRHRLVIDLAPPAPAQSDR